MNETQSKDTRYILFFNANEQLMIIVQKTHKVKERARPYLQRRLVNVTRLYKWSHNPNIGWASEYLEFEILPITCSAFGCSNPGLL